MNDPIKNCKWALYPLGDITQWWGENEALYTKAFKDSYPDYYKEAKKFIHSGIDIVRPYGEHLFAVEDGKVTEVKDSPTGYGKHIRFVSKKEDGIQREWVYGHLSYIHVKEGDKIKAGQYIANMGNTGFVVSNDTANGFWNDNPYRGTHLHLGCRIRKDGKVQDYYNGAFGRIDLLPLFRDPKLTSSKVLKIASATQNKTLFQLSQVLRTVGV